MERNPSVSIRTPESLSRYRKSVTTQSVMQWFASAKEHFTEEDIESVLLDPSRNFILDETGFSLSPVTERVLAIKGHKDIYFETSGKEKTNITLLDGKVERSTQKTHHISVSVGVNVSTPEVSYPSLLEKAKYNKASRFFSDDMALTNGFQVLEFLSRRETLLKPIASSEVEVEVHAEDEDDRQSLGSLLDEHLSYPSSPIPQSPDLQEAMSPGLSKPGTSFSRVVSPDLFSSCEDVDTQLKPTEASQEASVSVAEAENVPLPCASAEAGAPIMSQLMSMMQEMQNRLMSSSKTRHNQHQCQHLRLVVLSLLPLFLPKHLRLFH